MEQTGEKRPLSNEIIRMIRRSRLVKSIIRRYAQSLTEGTIGACLQIIFPYFHDCGGYHLCQPTVCSCFIERQFYSNSIYFPLLFVRPGTMLIVVREIIGFVDIRCIVEWFSDDNQEMGAPRRIGLKLKISVFFFFFPILIAIEWLFASLNEEV